MHDFRNSTKAIELLVVIVLVVEPIFVTLEEILVVEPVTFGIFEEFVLLEQEMKAEEQSVSIL